MQFAVGVSGNAEMQLHPFISYPARLKDCAFLERLDEGRLHPGEVASLWQSHTLCTVIFTHAWQSTESQPNMHVFFGQRGGTDRTEHWQRPDSGPRDQTMTLLVRRSKLKYRRQLKFLFHFVGEFSLCINWRRSNWILGNGAGDLFILLYYWFIWQLLNRISRIWHTLLPYTGLTTCSHLDKLDTHQFHH